MYARVLTCRPAKAPQWLRPPIGGCKEVDARNVERTTAKQYREHVNLHIVPSTIGQTKLAALTPERLEAFRDELLAKLSRPLARKVLTSLKSLVKVSRYSHVAVGVAIKKEKAQTALGTRPRLPERRQRSIGY